MTVQRDLRVKDYPAISKWSVILWKGGMDIYVNINKK